MERVGSSQPQSPTNSQEMIEMFILECKPREMPFVFLEKFVFADFRENAIDSTRLVQ